LVGNDAFGIVFARICAVVTVAGVAGVVVSG